MDWFFYYCGMQLWIWCLQLPCPTSLRTPTWAVVTLEKGREILDPLGFSCLRTRALVSSVEFQQVMPLALARVVLENHNIDINYVQPTSSQARMSTWEETREVFQVSIPFFQYGCSSSVHGYQRARLINDPIRTHSDLISAAISWL